MPTRCPTAIHPPHAEEIDEEHGARGKPRSPTRVEEDAIDGIAVTQLRHARFQAALARCVCAFGPSTYVLGEPTEVLPRAMRPRHCADASQWGRAARTRGSLTAMLRSSNVAGAISESFGRRSASSLWYARRCLGYCRPSVDCGVSVSSDAASRGLMPISIAPREDGSGQALSAQRLSHAPHLAATPTGRHPSGRRPLASAAMYEATRPPRPALKAGP